MYSNNDFRSYSENHLEHASAYGNFKFPGGKNTSEYNHAYYLRNKFRWGVDENNVGGVGAQGVSTDGVGTSKRNLKERINDFIDNTDTKLDDRARELYRNTRDAVRNAPSNAKKAINSRIDNSKTLADDYARSAVRSLRSGNTSAAKASAGRAARTAAYEAREGVKNAASNAKKAVNNRIDNSRTLADDYARSAARSLREGNVRAAATSAGRAARTAAYDVKTGVQDAATRSGRAVRDEAYRVSNTGLGNKFKSNEANTYSEGAKRRQSNQADRMYDEGSKRHQSNVGGVGSHGVSTDGVGTSKRNLKERVNQFIDNSDTKLDDRAREIYRNTRDAVKNAPENIRDAVNRRIDESDTIADDYARSAVRSLREGNFEQAGRAAGRAARTAAYETKEGVKNLGRNAAGAVYEGGKRLADTASDAYDRLRNRDNDSERRVARSSVEQNERRQEEYNSRSINPQTGRLNRTATRNTNTVRDNGDLTPIQKNRRQAEPERQKDSLVGKNRAASDTGTGSNAHRRALRNSEEAVKQENRIHNAQRGYMRSDYTESVGRMQKNQAEGMSEKDKEFMGYPGRTNDELISRGQRGKDFQNRRYLDASEQHGRAVTEMFKNIAESDGRVSSSAAARAVNAASSAINDYRRAVEAYGSGSDEAQEAYWEALNAIMGELDRKN